jgi:hypothetical protein
MLRCVGRGRQTAVLPCVAALDNTWSCSRHHRKDNAPVAVNFDLRVGICSAWCGGPLLLPVLRDPEQVRPRSAELLVLDDYQDVGVPGISTTCRESNPRTRIAELSRGAIIPDSGTVAWASVRECPPNASPQWTTSGQATSFRGPQSSEHRSSLGRTAALAGPAFANVPRSFPPTRRRRSRNQEGCLNVGAAGSRSHVGRSVNECELVRVRPGLDRAAEICRL